MSRSALMMQLGVGQSYIDDPDTACGSCGVRYNLYAMPIGLDMAYKDHSYADSVEKGGLDGALRGLSHTTNLSRYNIVTEEVPLDCGYLWLRMTQVVDSTLPEVIYAPPPSRRYGLPHPQWEATPHARTDNRGVVLDCYWNGIRYHIKESAFKENLAAALHNHLKGAYLFYVIRPSVYEQPLLEAMKQLKVTKIHETPLFNNRRHEDEQNYLKGFLFQV